VNASTRTLAAYGAVAVAAAGWGTWPLILRTAESMAKLHPTLESTVVLAVLTVVTGLFALRDRVAVRAGVRDWAGIAWLGVGDAANCAFFFAAYQTTSVAVAVLSHYLTPIFVTLAAPIFLRERGTARGWAAVGVAFAGLVVLLAPWQAGHGAHDALGAALGAASAVFYASNVIVNKRLTRAFSSSELMFYHGLVATPLLALLVPHGEWGPLFTPAMAVVAAGGVGPGALSGVLFVWGLRHIPAAHSSTLTLMEPLVAVLLGVVALGEPLRAAQVAGGGLILFGAALIFTQRAR
jgi:drug/metabolite transporter (DMT)-like permease